LNRDLAVIGAGSWGTALAIVLSPRFGRVRLWAHDPGLAVDLTSSRENRPYLPGFRLPDNIEATGFLEEAAAGTSTILLAVPSKFLRNVVRQLAPDLSGSETLISATKGIEKTTLARMSEIVGSETGIAEVAVLSGPTFAREIAAGQPAAVVFAAGQLPLAARLQVQLYGRNLRFYTNTDMVGVEIGAALKNVIAIAAGIVHGLELGNNTLAALVTRGLAEITRLAIALGGKPSTLAGLAGLGDLLLTCTGDLSRNRRVGIELARGCKLDDILGSTKMIAEGVDTTAAAVDLARNTAVEMPITEQMYLILKDGKSPQEGIRDLMDRALRSE
jgi:glycerol-3-phosphate dehydrogenase (NAD(P)+)